MPARKVAERTVLTQVGSRHEGPSSAAAGRPFFFASVLVTAVWPTDMIPELWTIFVATTVQEYLYDTCCGMYEYSSYMARLRNRYDTYVAGRPLALKKGRLHQVECRFSIVVQ